MKINESWYEKPSQIRTHEAAGGVVVKESGEGLLVAVIHEGLTAGVLPKGHVEAGESIEQAAVREVAEEAGLSRLKMIEKLGVRERLNFEKTSWKRTHYFLMLAGDAHQKAAPGEHEFRVEWVPLDDFPDLFWPEQTAIVRENAERIRTAVAASERSPTNGHE